MNKKYEVFIQLLNFNTEKYSAEKLFKDFIKLFAISLSNKVIFNINNKRMYDEIFEKYEKSERYIFYALSIELIKLFHNEKEPYDILGELYQNICNKSYLKLVTNNSLQEFGKKLQGVVNINKRNNNGKMLEMNCGTGAMILAYASTLKLFKLNYKFNLEVTAIDTDILNVFMTYIQLYFYEISAVVILADEKENKELMRLYTPAYDNDIGNLMVAIV